MLLTAIVGNDWKPLRQRVEDQIVVRETAEKRVLERLQPKDKNSLVGS